MLQECACMQCLKLPICSIYTRTPICGIGVTHRHNAHNFCCYAFLAKCVIDSEYFLHYTELHIVTIQTNTQNNHTKHEIFYKKSFLNFLSLSIVNIRREGNMAISPDSSMHSIDLPCSLLHTRGL